MARPGVPALIPLPVRGWPTLKFRPSTTQRLPCHGNRGETRALSCSRATCQKAPARLGREIVMKVKGWIWSGARIAGLLLLASVLFLGLLWVFESLILSR